MAACLSFRWHISSPRLAQSCGLALRPSLTLDTTSSFSRRLPQITAQQHRPASHAAQGVANRARRGPGKRLGLKRAATELVTPDTIIYRQRGTKWFPGENCGIGRDHSIYAKRKGYVVFYRDVWKGTGYKGVGLERGEDGKYYRRYIGIVFNRDDKLPREKGVPARRQLGMYTRARKDVNNGSAMSKDNDPLSGDRIRRDGVPVAKSLALSQGYQYRETNYMIGRVPERAGLKQSRLSPNAAKRRIARLWKVTRNNPKARAGVRTLEARWRKRRMGGDKDRNRVDDGGAGKKKKGAKKATKEVKQTRQVKR